MGGAAVDRSMKSSSSSLWVSWRGKSSRGQRVIKVSSKPKCVGWVHSGYGKPNVIKLIYIKEQTPKGGSIQEGPIKATPPLETVCDAG